MILKEFDIDLSESILVGDKNSDIEAGIKAEVGMNYLVSTGHTMTNNKFLNQTISSLNKVWELL